MGIKHFFMWFRTQFPENIHKLGNLETLGSKGVEIDNLMIDMNGLFHNAAQKVYEYGNFKPNQRLMSTKKKVIIPNIRTQKLVFEEICKNIDEMVAITNPKKRLILCVDGTAPLSKQNQQRQRRFKSAMESSSNGGFDSNCITPGTKFMDYLTKYVDWYIRGKITNEPKWQALDIIFSNEKAPGEGEHKIINYIRYYGDSNDTFCINGMDADLIMLALGTHLPKFYILREDMYTSNNKYFCLDIGNVHQDLVEILKWDSDKFEFNPKTAVDDFIFLCFMVGNDFLPHIPSIEIIENGIELILQIYREVGVSYGHITEKIDGKIRFIPQSLEVFLGTVGHHEKENFEAKLQNKQNFFTDLILEKSATQIDEKWNVDIETYKQVYWDQSFPQDISQEQICHEYLEGMQWVISYYTRGVPNWKWNYKYHYAPPASILSNNLKTFKFKEYPHTTPSTPYQQLLCVLPPKSAKLIPEPLCNLLINSNSPLKHFCPDVFEIDLAGKRKEWEGIVLLPSVDFELVQKAYLELLPKIEKFDLKCNTMGRSFHYQYNPSMPFLFKSYYGDIEGCKVKINMIDL
jgi:5'-3' exoribonuclease 1